MTFDAVRGQVVLEFLAQPFVTFRVAQDIRVALR